MFSQLKEITDERAVLLLYLTDELSGSDRQEVERRLAGDARLAAELAELQAAHSAYLEGMSVLDAATKPAVPLAAAQQRANRAVRQWATRRLANPLPAARTRHFLPAWAYPAVAAAAVAVAVIWWGVYPGDKRIEDKQIAETGKGAIDELTDSRHQNLNPLVEVVDDSGAAQKDADADGIPADEDSSVATADFNEDISLFLGLDDQSNAKEGTR